MEYLKILLIFISLDIIWIYFIMTPKYKPMVSKIQGKDITFNYIYAVLAYTLMALGLFVFVLPNIKEYNDIFKYGTLFGFIVYGVYDFTCAAIFEDFDKNTMIIDIMWGCLLYTITPLIYKLT